MPVTGKTLEERFTEIEERVVSWDEYLRRLQSSKAHYLRKKQCGRVSKQKAVYRTVSMLKRLCKILGTMRLTLDSRVKNNRPFFCSPLQARKLRRLADFDLRLAAKKDKEKLDAKRQSISCGDHRRGIKADKEVGLEPRGTGPGGSSDTPQEVHGSV